MEINNDEILLTWTIDRTPSNNYTIYNMDSTDNMNYVNDLNIVNYSIVTGIVNTNHYNDDDDFIPFHNMSETDDFIPFEHTRIPIAINFVLETLTISENDLNCCICMEKKENPQICKLNCSHKFCSNCTADHVSRNRHNSFCPLCRTYITDISVQTEEDLEIFENLKKL